MSALLNCTASVRLIYSVNEPLLLDNQSFQATPGVSSTFSLVNGTSGTADAIDAHYEDPGVTLAPSASKTYTLSALVDQLTRTIPFVDLHTFILTVTSRTAGDYLTYGPGATHGWTALVATGTQKCFGTVAFHVDKTDVLAVAANSNDQLTITNAGSHPITYTLALAGNAS